MNQQTPNWQPISALPLIASLIDGMVSDTREQWENLQPARAKPHVLDSALVERIEHAYSEQRARGSRGQLQPVHLEALALSETDVSRICREHEPADSSASRCRSVV